MLAATERNEIGGETNDVAWANVLGFIIANAALATGAVIVVMLFLGVVSTFLIGTVATIFWVLR